MVKKELTKLFPLKADRQIGKGDRLYPRKLLLLLLLLLLSLLRLFGNAYFLIMCLLLTKFSELC